MVATDLQSGTPESELVLELVRVAVPSIHRPTATILADVDWQVRRGEFWVVGGPPASGKSDLLVTAAGLMRPKSGVVRFFGKELDRLHEEERLSIHLRVGMVFGYGGRLFNHLTVADNLALPLCYHRNCSTEDTARRTDSILEAMGLSDVRHILPGSLNRNLRQRVALARAFMLSPELLFLDNPLIGLDPREMRWWKEFFAGPIANPALVGKRPLTVVVGTDDLEPWGSEERQFAFIQEGRFVGVGSRAELIRQSNPALRELLPVGWLNK